jgi:hypothetical protein
MSDIDGTWTDKNNRTLREIKTEKSYIFGLYKRRISTMVTQKEYERLILDKKLNDTVGMIADVMPALVATSLVGGIVNAVRKKK